MEQGIAAHVREMQQGLASIDALTRSFAELHQGLREEREQRRVDVEHLAQSVVAKVDECKPHRRRASRADWNGGQHAEAGRRGHLQAPGEGGRRAGRARDRGQRVANAAGRRRSQGGHPRRQVPDHRAHRDCVVKSALNAEKEERVAEDEQIVHAINDYTRALQDGLRIVNQS